MVHGRISPKTKDRFRKSIRDVINGLSKKVLVYKQPIKFECDNCYYDKLTARSTGKCKWTLEDAEEKQREYESTNPGVLRYKWFRVGRCPVCKGDGFLRVERKAWTNCLVIWNYGNKFNNDMTYTPAGTEGSTLVQLKTDPKHFDLFKNCTKIVIEGVECKMSKPPILRGLGNQSVLIITAFTTDKPKVDSGEIMKEYT